MKGTCHALCHRQRMRALTSEMRAVSRLFSMVERMILFRIPFVEEKPEVDCAFFR